MAGFDSPAAVVDWLVSTVRRFGLENLFKRYYGTYRGIVEDTADPERRGRARVRILVLGQDQAPDDLWALPVLPMMSQKHGLFLPPEVGDLVWVQFENGDPVRPLYMGGILSRSQVPDEFTPTDDGPFKRGIRTPAGHWVRFNDDPADPHVTISAVGGGYATMDKDGNVLLANKNGSNLYLNAKDGQTTLMDQSGATVTMVDGVVALISADGSVVTVDKDAQVITPGNMTVTSGGKVTLKAGAVDIGDGAQQAVVLGTSFALLYGTHIHMGNLGVPTGPPLSPMIPGTHTSTAVKTR